MITSTVGLNTTVTTDTFDAADQLTSASARANGGSPPNTAYSYDGDGNQTGSAGPAGTVTDSYNDLRQLTHVTGPGTDLSLVSDGQGDRLRSYEQGTPTWTLRNDAQDIQTGLSSLVSDGQQDYSYLQLGAGGAPLAGYSPATARTTYLGTDLVGSVRLATDPTDAAIGAGGYDAWGVARAYQGSGGQTLLAGLQGSVPFGYAGQYLDSGPGTYAMRARQYDPSQGRFLSEDPLAPDQQLPVTIDPYEYAGDMPAEVTDPSGQGWVIPEPSQDFGEQSNIAGRSIENLVWFGLPMPGEVQQAIQPRFTYPGYDLAPVQYWVRVFKYPLPPCRSHPTLGQLDALVGPRDAFSANVIDRRSGAVWDIEHAEAYTGSLGGEVQRRLVDNANAHGYWWKTATCNELTQGSFRDCTPQILSRKDGLLHKGSGYPAVFPGLQAEQINIADFGISGPPLAKDYKPGRILPTPLGTFLVAWEQEPGLILYKVLSRDALYKFVRGEHRENPALPISWFGVGFVGDSLRLRDYGTELGGCFCFPAGTKVATASGLMAIDKLHVGDTVLAEDPKKGTVEPQRILAVIDDGVKPLLQLDLSDGSALRVTSNHPFYVDSGTGLHLSGWLQAGRLRPGDRLRTASGRDVAVLAVHWNVGEARVYTLTVASDHTFFAGTAQVLVHNCSDRPPFDHMAAIAKARVARAQIGEIPEDKTVAATARGIRTLSGWKPEPGFVQTTDDVLAHANIVGFTFPPANPSYRDGSPPVPGRYQASHAELQMTEAAPNEPFAVSRPMCLVCQAYLARLAEVTQEPQTVLDPAIGRIFYPDGMIEEFR